MSSEGPPTQNNDFPDSPKWVEYCLLYSTNQFTCPVKEPVPLIPSRSRQLNRGAFGGTEPRFDLLVQRDHLTELSVISRPHHSLTRLKTGPRYAAFCVHYALNWGPGAGSCGVIIVPGAMPGARLAGRCSAAL